MAEILNFAALSRPFLPVVMRDEEQTEIRVTPGRPDGNRGRAAEEV